MEEPVVKNRGLFLFFYKNSLKIQLLLWKGDGNMKTKDDIVTYEIEVNKTALREEILMWVVFGALGLITDAIIFLPALLLH